MFNPAIRPRRLRRTAAIRAWVRETALAPSDLTYPLFVEPGRDTRTPIAAMPGQTRFTVDLLGTVVKELRTRGIESVLLFGLPAAKDAQGSESYAAAGIVQQAVRAVKDAEPAMAVITDVCLCSYTDHGHCGLVNARGDVLNDATLAVLRRIAVSHADAGADAVAPSGMMDNMVAALRAALDERQRQDTAILSYAVKYASAFYGPFREAAAGAPRFGDRSTYQMDPANRREALKEAQLDLAQGADMIMVKPALAYLDVIREIRAQAPQAPLFAYNVSGEYAMLKAAAQQGWLNEQAAVLEILGSVKRAGADQIITYHAADVAGAL